MLLATATALMGWWAVHRREPQAPVQMLLLGMAMLAVGIGIGVDVVTVQPDVDRMNTVFRLFLNAWVLLSIVGGVGLWHLWATGGLRWRGGRWPRYGRQAWLALLAVLVLASAVFPVVGTRARLVYRFDTSVGLTLDGAAFQQVAVYGDPGPTSRQDDDRRYALRDDAEALEFMRQNISGSPDLHPCGVGEVLPFLNECAVPIHENCAPPTGFSHGPTLSRAHPPARYHRRDVRFSDPVRPLRPRRAPPRVALRL